MDRRVILVAALLSLCGCSLPGPAGKKVAPGGRAAQPVEETPAWSLQNLREAGFVAESSVTVSVERGDMPVEIGDAVVMDLRPGGDFSFRRTRTHRGASDGASEESFAAIRKGADYFTAGSSGQWVRWDDALEQPDGVVDSFIRDEDALLGVVQECGRQGAPDEAGRIPITGLTDSCAFATGTPADSNNRRSGNVKAITGYLTMNGNTPSGAAVDIDVLSPSGGVEASVKLKYVLKIQRGPVGPDITVPAEFMDSRRPRPVKMVDSVLSGIVDEWGPGAPGVLRKRPAGSDSDRH